MDVAAIVSSINAIHHTDYTLRQRFAGGYQDGAFELVTAHGQRHVLKLKYAPRALPLIQQLCTLGYPTPAIRYSGQLGDHMGYVVQEFVPGTPLATLTPALVEQLLHIIEQQANLNPTPQAVQHSWSLYAHEVVFANASDWAALLRRSTPATAQLLAGIERVVAPFEGLSLPNTDIVHGDFNIENVLAVQGRLTGVIDMLFAGYGTRAIDLATLLHFAYTHDYGPAVRERLQERIRAIIGHGGVCICLTYRIIAMVAWAIERDPGALDHYVHTGWQILRDLGGEY